MPITQPGDFGIGGRWFMLARTQDGKRSWQRTGVADIPSRRQVTDTMYGNVPDTLDHPEVWNDWSGGFGDYTRVPERPNTYHWANNVDCRFPKQVIRSQIPQLLPDRYATVGNTNVNYFINFPSSNADKDKVGHGAIFFLGRNGIGRLTPTQYPYTGGSAFEGHTLETAFTSGSGSHWGNRPAIYGSYAYFPNLNGSAFLRRELATVAWTVGPAPARWFAPAAGRLWFNTDGAIVRSVASPEIDAMTVGNYAASLWIGGEGARRSLDAMAVDDQLYIGFPEGVYQGNLTGTFTNIAADLEGAIDADNCRDLTAYQGGLAFAQGPHVWWYRPSTGGNSELREVGPSALSAARSPVRGRFTALKGNGKWLYAALFTGSQSYFMVGRDASPPLPYVWHPLHDFQGLTCKVHRIYVDGITAAANGDRIPQRIWCATEQSFGARAGATAPVFYWPIPTGDDNPLGDPSFSPNYLGSARLDLPFSDWGAPGAAKVWRSAEFETERLDGTSVLINPYFFWEGPGGGSGVLGSLGVIGQSPKATTYFARGIYGSPPVNFVQGTSLGLSIRDGTFIGPVTWVLKSVVVRGALRPRSVDTITARARVADGMTDRYGKPMPPAHVQLGQLRAAATGSGPTILTDITGATQIVAVIPPVEEEEFYQVGQDEPEVLATVRMAVLEFTVGANQAIQPIDPPPLF